MRYGEWASVRVCVWGYMHHKARDDTEDTDTQEMGKKEGSARPGKEGIQIYTDLNTNVSSTRTQTIQIFYPLAKSREDMGGVDSPKTPHTHTHTHAIWKSTRRLRYTRTHTKVRFSCTTTCMYYKVHTELNAMTLQYPHSGPS